MAVHFIIAMLGSASGIENLPLLPPSVEASVFFYTVHHVGSSRFESLGFLT